MEKGDLLCEHSPVPAASSSPDSPRRDSPDHLEEVKSSTSRNPNTWSHPNGIGGFWGFFLRSSKGNSLIPELTDTSTPASGTRGHLGSTRGQPQPGAAAPKAPRAHPSTFPGIQPSWKGPSPPPPPRKWKTLHPLLPFWKKKKGIFYFSAPAGSYRGSRGRCAAPEGDTDSLETLLFKYFI